MKKINLQIKDVAKKFGISPDDFVTCYADGNKAVIEIDLKTKSSQAEEIDVFTRILSMAEEVVIRDWSLNHDHYLYGTPKRSDKERDG